VRQNSLVHFENWRTRLRNEEFGLSHREDFFSPAEHPKALEEAREHKNDWFKPPTLEINRLIHFATVTFTGTNLALECILDEREAWVEFKVARVVNGVKAQDYAVDQNGNRVRDNLFLMLQRRGVREFGLKSEHLAEQEIPEMFRIKVNAYASLLRK